MGGLEENLRVERDQRGNSQAKWHVQELLRNSQPRITSGEQINYNTVLGDFFPEFLCQNIRQTRAPITVHNLAHTGRALGFSQKFSVPVCEGFCSNRTAQTLADRSPYSPGFCTSTKFALQLRTSSKD